jgi:hypothetical protein
MFRTDARTMERFLMTNVYDKTEEDEVPLLGGDMRHGHSVFQCETCKTQRSYGYGTPDIGKERVMLFCRFVCGIHTWHKFLKVY